MTQKGESEYILKYQSFVHIHKYIFSLYFVHQVCFVMIESLSHTTDDLIFKWNFTNPLYVSPEIQLPQVLTIV